MRASSVPSLRSQYASEGMVKIPRDCFPDLPTPEQVRTLGDKIIAFAQLGTEAAGRIDQSMEVIRVAIGGAQSDAGCVIERRQVLTRLENFVLCHSDWSRLCCTGGLLSEIVGLICSEEFDANDCEAEKWCLYKEKLNIKPAGGTGFAPHFDNPSLQVTGLCDNFITVMIAIDDMTKENGCLRVVRGSWTEGNTAGMRARVDLGDSANPDGEGRQGAMKADVVDSLQWEDVECCRGDVFIFSGWIPHRSGVNATQLPRRAVFLTYNGPDDGDLREDYYRVMRMMRARYEKISHNR